MKPKTMWALSEPDSDRFTAPWMFDTRARAEKYMHEILVGGRRLLKLRVEVVEPAPRKKSRAAQ